MSNQICHNGHQYDSDFYPNGCPYCAQQNVNFVSDMPTTIPLDVDVIDSSYDETMKVSPISAGGIGAAQTVPLNQLADTVPLKNGKGDETIGYMPDQFKQDGRDDKETVHTPVVGWLVCLTGKHRGKSFCIYNGKNPIGRNSDMRVILEGESSVSREKHGGVIYDYRNNVFYVEPGDSKELVYLNGKMVNAALELVKNDVVSVGIVDLMFIPLCDEKFTWESGLESK